MPRRAVVSGQGAGRSLVRVVGCRRLLSQTDHWASAYWTGLQVFELQAGSVGPWVWSRVGSAEPLATGLDLGLGRIRIWALILRVGLGLVWDSGLGI